MLLFRNENQKAWERADMKEPLSVFSSHLLKHIDEHIPLTQLMTQKVVPSKSSNSHYFVCCTEMKAKKHLRQQK